MDKFSSDTLANVADTVVEKDYRFEIIIRPQNKLQGWLQKIGISPKKKEFTICPIVIGNLIRISKLLLTIDRDALKSDNFLDLSYNLMSEHADKLATILAIAIQNSKNEPSPKLVALIRNNLAMEEMFQLLAYVLDKMDHKNFISSIISIRGLNVLESGKKPTDSNEVSPLNQGS